MKSTAVPSNSWQTGAGMEWAGKKNYQLEEREEVGDGGAEGLSATGGGGPAAISLMPDADGTGSGSLLDAILSALLKKWSSDVWLIAPFSLHRWCGSTGLHPKWLLQSSCTMLFGSCTLKINSASFIFQIKKIPLTFLVLWVSLVLQLHLLPLVCLCPFSETPILSGFH